MTNRELYRFLIIAFLVAVATQAVAITAGVHGAGRMWLLLTMWAPTIAALTSSSASRAAAKAVLRRSGWRSFGWALLVGASMFLLQMALLVVAHAGHWNDMHFPLAADGHGVNGIHGLAMVLGVGPQQFWWFAINLVVTVSTSAFFVALIGGIGEELGWRGVLQPELTRRFGPIRGTLLVGVIWAYWHVPVNLAGYNDSAHPLLNTLVFFPFVVIAMSFGFAWLVERSRSVWPAAVAHGMNNTLGSGLPFIAATWRGDQLSMLAAAALVGGLFAWRLHRPHMQRVTHATPTGRIEPTRSSSAPTSVSRSR